MVQRYSPWDPSRLQLVGDVHVPGPDVELPLPESQHAAQHGARVNPDTHVDVVFRTRSHVSGRKHKESKFSGPPARFSSHVEQENENKVCWKDHKNLQI